MTAITRFRRSVAFVFGVALLLSMTVGGAFAAESKPPLPKPQLPGMVSAQGKGMVKIEGKGVVTLTGAGEAWVKGATELKAEGKGKRETVSDGTVHFSNWYGVIRARGDAVMFYAKGDALTIRAEGTGTAILKGHGRYETRSTHGEWKADGVTVAFAPAPKK